MKLTLISNGDGQLRRDRQIRQGARCACQAHTQTFGIRIISTNAAGSCPPSETRSGPNTIQDSPPPPFRPQLPRRSIMRSNE